jgi:hypothetical protein
MVRQDLEAERVGIGNVSAKKFIGIYNEICDGHLVGFEFLRRMPRSILYDNTKAAVARILGDGRRELLPLEGRHLALFRVPVNRGIKNPFYALNSISQLPISAIDPGESLHRGTTKRRRSWVTRQNGGRELGLERCAHAA